MAAEVILRVKVDKTQYKAFKEEVKKGLDAGGTNKVKDSLKETGEAAQNAKTKIQSLGEMLTKKIAWYSISMAISSVTVAFKEALQEIKAVDTQLTNVAKVSGKSMEDLQDLAEKAYSTASKYGVEASKYMEAVYEYTKAGFQDNADVMAELSTKAMLVGDTTAAVADKFLIAANAAWKYGKNVDELSLLVDKADYINNNYATTFDKIADGFPRVASVAAMAGMTAEETMAALGTITATTQETASRAGTALRALILNILGDTTTEVEDGVTTTQEEIDSLRKVLEIYAKDVVDAADATGTLINPMEAIAGLAEAYRKGALTERELFQIEKSLGGKLRTNQLDALLKNFDETYTSMMNGMTTAYGTADKEIETMLGSWEAKTNILKNTWTEFVSKGLSSEMFKDAIDWVTKLIDRFGGLNEIIPIVAGAMTALFAPAVAMNIDKIITNVKGLKTAFGNLFSGIRNQPGAMANAIGTAVSLIATAITVAYTLYKNHIMKIRQEADQSIEEAEASAKQAQDSFDSIVGLYQTYKNAQEGTDEYTTATENLCAALGIEKEAIDDVIGSIDELTAKQLEQKIGEMDAALITEQAAVLKKAESYTNTSNPIIQAGWRERATSNIYNGNGDLIDSTTTIYTDAERIKNSVNAYKLALDEYDALFRAYQAKQKGNALDLTGDVYAVDFYSRYTEQELRTRMSTVKGYIDEAEAVKKYITLLDAKDEYDQALEDLKNGEGTVDNVKTKYNNLAKAQKDVELSAEEMAAAQEKLADAFKNVTGQAVDATNALNKYNDAVNADQAEENADALANAAKSVYEAFDKKLVDSAEVKAFADMWFTTDQIAKFKKQGISMAQALANDPNFNRIFPRSKDEEGNDVFRTGIESAQELVKMFKEFDTDNNGLMTKLIGNTDITMARLEETDYGIRVVVEDWKALSQEMGINEGALKLLLNAYGLLIPGLEASTADLLAFADAAGAVTTNVEGIKEVDLAKVISDAFAQGATQDTVWDLVAALQKAQENGDLKLVVDEEEVKNANDTAKDLINNMDDVVDAEHVIDVDDKQLSQAVTMADNLRIKLDSLNGKTVTIHVAVNGNGAETEKVKGALDEWINRNSIFASGTDNAPGGMALVNEEGAELIAANGVAWIAGGGRPSIAPIPKGAKIWTAKETNAILSNSNLSPLFSGIDAFASGTSVPSAISGVSSTTMWEGANLFAQDYEDDELKGLQGMVSLRKSELELIKERGGSLDEQNEKQKQIQEAIVDVVRKLQNIGGKQEDINQLAAEWYQIQTEIEESGTSEMETLEKETSLRKSELSLLEAKGASNAKQVAKQREIQESLMAQVKYLKSIGGDQEEINKLLTEYYNIDKQITENEKQRAEQKKQKAKNREETLYSNLQAAIEKRMENINKKRDEALKQIDEEKKKLQEEHDIQQQNQELQEKQLAVEKAREELANAKKQRTVRIFNSATGQWEWTYNASTVNAAKENLTNAKDALSEYKKEQAYQKRIDSLEAKQQEINDKYDARVAKWQAVLDTMEEPVKSIHSVLRSIEKHATEDMLPTIEKMNEALKTIGDGYVISPEVQKKMMGIGVGQTPGTYRNLGGVPVNVSGTPYGIGTQYNGDTYTFGNITLSEQQAKTTTVYQLTQMAGGLRSYAYGT